MIPSVPSLTDRSVLLNKKESRHIAYITISNLSHSIGFHWPSSPTLSSLPLALLRLPAPCRKKNNNGDMFRIFSGFQKNVLTGRYIISIS